MLHLTRRELLAASGLAAAALALPGPALAALTRPRQRTRSLRLAHLTDPHIQPELRAGEGVGACLEHMMAQKDRPELVLTGGDHVFDSFSQEEARAAALWKLWRTVWKDHCSLPAFACIGNHDMWGWDKKGSKTTGEEPNWGVKRATDELAMPAPYHAFDRAGWRFIVLSTVQPAEGGYEGGVDEAQLAWLEDQIKAAKGPVLILSHIPIIHASMLLVADNKKPREVSRGKFCMNALKLVSLFERYPAVKLCLSGHIHTLERIDFQGVSYLCNGAVCGNWWKGNKPDSPGLDRANEGYSLIDLFDDGSFEAQYQTYGWKASQT